MRIKMNERKKEYYNEVLSERFEDLIRIPQREKNAKKWGMGI
jgi:hypothetical protein